MAAGVPRHGVSWLIPRQSENLPTGRMPIRRIRPGAACWARAATVQMAAMPSPAMSSRRRIWDASKSLHGQPIADGAACERAAIATEVEADTQTARSIRRSTHRVSSPSSIAAVRKSTVLWAGYDYRVCPAVNIAAGTLCSNSKPVFVTRTHWPNWTPAFSSFVMTFGCTTMHMFSSSTHVGG